MTDALHKAHERLQEAVAAIVSGDDWKQLLQVASKFHSYSFNNHLLILCQRPDATLVAGFNKWKSLGRFVKKGEKGIAIFAPCKYRTKIEAEDGEEQTVQQLRGFRLVHVFDISQTDGEPLPDLDVVRPKLLNGDAPEGLWDALTVQAEAAGFAVVRRQNRQENGYCDFHAREIGVRPDVMPAQAVKTLVHELAHAKLHGDRGVRTRELEEVEVESVAYVVCDALGLDTGDYSFAYVARWAEGSTELIKDTAERVVGCSKEILAGLESSSQSRAETELAS